MTSKDPRSGWIRPWQRYLGPNEGPSQLVVLLQNRYELTLCKLTENCDYRFCGHLLFKGHPCWDQKTQERLLYKRGSQFWRLIPILIWGKKFDIVEAGDHHYPMEAILYQSRLVIKDDEGNRIAIDKRNGRIAIERSGNVNWHRVN
jgi:hypothetical protein